MLSYFNDSQNRFYNHSYTTSRSQDGQDIAFERLDNGKRYVAFDGSSIYFCDGGNSDNWGSASNPSKALFSKNDIGKTIYFYAWRYGFQPW